MFPRQSRRNDRGGAVTVEFALTAPLLFMLVMGSIEFSRANMLLHSTTVAASEAARKGIIPGATAADVESVARQELSYMGIAEAQVVVRPAVITDDTKLVTVGVRVPINAANGYMIPQFFLGKGLEKIMSMPREAKKDIDMDKAIGDAEKAMKAELKAAEEPAKATK